MIFLKDIEDICEIIFHNYLEEEETINVVADGSICALIIKELLAYDDLFIEEMNMTSSSGFNYVLSIDPDGSIMCSPLDDFVCISCDDINFIHEDINSKFLSYLEYDDYEVFCFGEEYENFIKYDNDKFCCCFCSDNKLLIDKAEKFFESL